MTLFAILIASHIAVAIVCWRIGCGRNAAVRGEIARVGAMFVSEMEDLPMVTQEEVNELTRRIDQMERAIERLQERLAAFEAPLRPVQAQRILFAGDAADPLYK